MYMSATGVDRWATLSGMLGRIGWPRCAGQANSQVHGLVGT